MSQHAFIVLVVITGSACPACPEYIEGSKAEGSLSKGAVISTNVDLLVVDVVMNIVKCLAKVRRNEVPLHYPKEDNTKSGI